MSDERDRNDEAQRRAGLRRVYQRGDGTYHVESAPGAGPEHHDDLPLTPDDVERKDAGEPVTLDLGAMAEQANRKIMLVTGPTGRLAALYLGMDEAQAHAHARALGGLVAELPIVADYR